MKDSEMELLLRSFDDEDFGASERRRLEDLLEQSAELKSEHARMRRLRTVVSGSAADTFESDFADRVMADVARASMVSSRLPTTRDADDHAANLRHAPDRHSAGRAVEKSERISNRISGWMSVRNAAWMAGGVAAVVVLLIAVGVFLRAQPHTTSVPYGEPQLVVLRDGTMIDLSGGSTLTYPRAWEGDERRVLLDGEAYFDVPENDIPFVVQTFNADVTVLGTRFNVRAWEDDPRPETAVTLEIGRVAVAPRREGQEDDRADVDRENAGRAEQRVDADRAEEYQSDDRQAAESMLTMSQFAPGAVVLEPGQMIAVTADSTVAPRSVSIDRVLAWRSGGLAFVDQPLGSVFNTIERRFDVDVEALDPTMRDRLLTYLNPHPASAEEVISDICHTLDLRYRRTANGYEVMPGEIQ